MEDKVIQLHPPAYTQSGWTIKTLGEPLYDSPLEVITFNEDKDKVLLNPHVDGSHSPIQGGSKMVDPNITLEKAGPRQKIFFNPFQVIAGIVTCGGLCPALNNVIRSITNCLVYRYGVKKVIGFKYGYEGLNPAKSEIIELTPKDVRDIHDFGGTILGSSRGPQPVDVMVDYLVSLKVSILFAIGGDGTLKGANAIAQECVKRGLLISVIGIPKTIDNDISYVEQTFGFETAVECAQKPIKAAHEEARSARNGIGIVKLMGRESGFIALNSSLASGDVNLLLIPEMKFTMDGIINFILKRFESSRDHCVIVVSEGAGQDLCSPDGKLGKDASGNSIFGDIGIYLKSEISKRLKAINVEHTIKYIDPSYTIRSAVPVASDAVFALHLGQMAVHAAMAGKTGMVIASIHNQFVHMPMERCTEFRQKVNLHGLAFQVFLDCSGMPLSLC